LGNIKVDQAATARPEAIEVPHDLFGCIVGYDDVKDEIKFTLTGGRKNHYLLIGPPATTKSLFLMELGRLRGTYPATGSRVTAAGLTDAFLVYQPKVLLLDEIDKIPMDATAVLLSAMETGDILVTKYKAHRRLKLEVIVFAAGNTDRTVAPELLSRFDTKLYFSPYTFQDFITICSVVVIRLCQLLLSSENVTLIVL
jgi:Holliday junction DNA helicase RuvB